jgi:predicted ribosomally synthesized peptide with nif11-like leader
MSEEQLKGFLEAVAADAELQEKLKAAADTDAVVEIAKAAGFVIYAEELEALVLQAQAEISEEELQGVAGGKRGRDEGYASDSAVAIQGAFAAAFVVAGGVIVIK